jgi:hypothetical protein
VYASYNDTIAVTHTSSGTVSDGSVIPYVVDPTKLTGKTYRTTFRNVTTNFIFGTDTITTPILNWYVSSGSDTMARGVNQGPTVVVNPGNTHTGDPGPSTGNLYDYPITDGFYVTVSGPPPQLNADRTGFAAGNVNWLRGTGRFVSSTDLLRSQATTSFDVGNYLGACGPGVDPSLYHTVEFRFGAGGSLTQKAYRLRRIGTYQFQDYVNVPFQVWDVQNPQSPRQLNCAWRDNNNNGTWDLFSTASGLLVEVIFVATSTYDGDVSPPPTPHYSITPGDAANQIPVKDHQILAEWGSATGLIANVPASTITVSPNFVNSANDVFTFTAPSAPTYNASTAKADVTQINVFPNPYYGFNRAETSKSTRFVTFNHMPPKAEVRIFNLAGALVRALVKDDPTQYFTWDLNNTGGLPVASGVYIAYMTLKDASGVDLGTKTLKLVVIQEQQYLDNF